MEEYVDVFSDKWTKRLKMIAWIRFAIRLFFTICCCITIIIVFKAMAPYINGSQVWEDMPFTLSQLEAILSVLVFAYLMKNASRVI